MVFYLIQQCKVSMFSEIQNLSQTLPHQRVQVKNLIVNFSDIQHDQCLKENNKVLSGLLLFEGSNTSKLHKAQCCGFNVVTRLGISCVLFQTITKHQAHFFSYIVSVARKQQSKTPQITLLPAEIIGMMSQQTKSESAQEMANSDYNFSGVFIQKTQAFLHV